jgi:ABC-2 type transport system permease protein
MNKRNPLAKVDGFQAKQREKRRNKVYHPFWTIVQKEIGDHVRSWRFIILLAIISLTCLGSLYTATMSLRETAVADNADKSFFFLRLFTTADADTGLPAFITFVSFLGPLLGIALGFDAVNSERNKGTLSRIMSQPIHRDYLLNAKFVAALIVITILFAALTFLVMGFGLFMLGIPPTPEEFLRMLAFLVLTVFYVGFWLNLSILFSVRFRQPATSALAGISIWLFFSVFFSLILNLIGNALMPSADATTEDFLGYQQFMEMIARLSPSQLFSEATVTLLMPSVRSLSSFLTIDQLIGAIPGPLPIGQSLLLVWPQITALIAATMICFAISYVMFMRQEIRSR